MIKLNRSDEQRLLADQGVGSIPWSPLAKGWLARPWNTSTSRTGTDNLTRRYREEAAHKPIVEAVEQVAAARGVPMAQVALAWHFTNPSVVAPIVGPSTAKHLDDAAASVNITLADDEVKILEQPYTPRLPSGFS